MASSKLVSCLLFALFLISVNYNMVRPVEGRQPQIGANLGPSPFSESKEQTCHDGYGRCDDPKYCEFKCSEDWAFMNPHAYCSTLFFGLPSFCYCYHDCLHNGN